MSKVIDYSDISIVIPAKNEAESLPKILSYIKEHYSELHEVIVVNDGSTDNTSEICKQFEVTEITHPFSMGNGASLKAGAKQVKSKYHIFMDADGQHPPEIIPRIIEAFSQGYSLTIAARDPKSHANKFRRIANAIYNRFASYVTGHKILDITSGFRMFETEKFNQFSYLYPNGFSCPTTSTMAFLKSGYSVSFISYSAEQRDGQQKSHINVYKDGLKFFLIIFRVATLYSPLKIFFPVSLTLFMLGMGNYIHTFVTEGRFTNMSALLLMTSMLIFMIGLISEQITLLTYKK